MTSTNQTTADTRECDRLALACLAHLQQEEAGLGRSLDRLYGIRKAVLHRDQEALRAALTAHDGPDSPAEELAVVRRQLRQQIARALQVPEQNATLSVLARHASADVGRRLSHCRERLAQLAAEVDRISRANSLLLRQSAELLDRILGALTGSGESCQRYAPDGRMRATSRHNVLQEEC